jgi:hypothetical protein
MYGCQRLSVSATGIVVDVEAYASQVFDEYVVIINKSCQDGYLEVVPASLQGELSVPSLNNVFR